MRKINTQNPITKQFSLQNCNFVFVFEFSLNLRSFPLKCFALLLDPSTCWLSQRKSSLSRSSTSLRCYLTS